MWKRKELKQRAKAVLKIIYWKASLIILLAGGKDGGVSGGSSRSSDAWHN